MDYNFLNNGLKLYRQANVIYNNTYKYINSSQIDEKTISRLNNKLNKYWEELMKIIFGKSKNSFNIIFDDSSYDNRYETEIYKNNNINITNYRVYMGCDTFKESFSQISINGSCICNLFKNKTEIVLNTKWITVVENIIDKMNNIDIEGFKTLSSQIKIECQKNEENLLNKNRKQKQKLLDESTEIQEYL